MSPNTTPSAAIASAVVAVGRGPVPLCSVSARREEPGRVVLNDSKLLRARQDAHQDSVKIAAGARALPEAEKWDTPTTTATSPTRSCSPDIASTPLFIKLPNQHSGGYDDRHVRTFDIVPTIADAAAIKMPWKVDGQSVLEHGDPAPVAVYREQGKKGSVFRSSLAGYERARRAALERKTDLFRHGLYGIGPHPELIGTDPGNLGTPVGRLTPEIRKLLEEVDTRSSFLPANITGEVTSEGAHAGMPLALVLNDRIAAVGWSAQLKGDKRVYFSFFAPPSAFRDGGNSARVYALPR
jgi:hypothetical protein